MSIINLFLNLFVILLILIVFGGWFKEYSLRELRVSSIFIFFSFLILLLSRLGVIISQAFSYSNSSFSFTIPSYIMLIYTILVPLCVLLHLVFLFGIQRRWVLYYVFSGLIALVISIGRQLILPDSVSILNIESPVGVIGVFYLFSLILIFINKLFTYKGVDELLFGWVLIVSMNLGIIVLAVTNRLLDGTNSNLLTSDRIERFSIVDGPFQIALANIMAIGALLYLYKFSDRILSGDIGYKPLSQIIKIKSDVALESYSNGNIWIKPIVKTENISVESLHILENIQKIIDYEIHCVIDNEFDLEVLSSIYAMSQKTKINVDDLEYLFKYHCKYSFSRYSKFIKICKADYLIQKGFLNNSTVDELANMCGFENRVTLFNNFKFFLNSTIRDRKPSKNTL